MSLETLLQRLNAEGAVTPVAPRYPDEVTPKPAPVLACTPVTPVTPKQLHSQGDWDAAFQERAAILEYDAGLSRDDAERQAWQMTEAERTGYWSEEEVATAKHRTADFVRRGVPERVGDLIACRLVQRDREQDDRRSCAECHALHDGACILGRSPVGGDGVLALHRCGDFIEPLQYKPSPARPRTTYTEAFALQQENDHLPGGDDGVL